MEETCMQFIDIVRKKYKAKLFIVHNPSIITPVQFYLLKQNKNI